MDLIEQKANELVERFMIDAMFFVTNARNKHKCAIQCAIICVDEIINAFDDCSCSPILEGTLSVRDWQQVRKRLLAKQ